MKIFGAFVLSDVLLIYVHQLLFLTKIPLKLVLKLKMSYGTPRLLCSAKVNGSFDEQYESQKFIRNIRNVIIFR